MEHIRRLQHLALDQDNNIVDIKNTEDNKKYYCPYCHKEMITKRGAIREWHFAHKTPSDKCLLLEFTLQNPVTKKPSFFSQIAQRVPTGTYLQSFNVSTNF